MIKKLTKRFQLKAQIILIKKHFHFAKNISNYSERNIELEKVNTELFNFEEKIKNNNAFNEKISNELSNLQDKLDKERIKCLPVTSSLWPPILKF